MLAYNEVNILSLIAMVTKDQLFWAVVDQDIM